MVPSHSPSAATHINVDTIMAQVLGRQAAGLKEIPQLLCPRHFGKVFLSHPRVSWRRRVPDYEDTLCDLAILHH